MSHRSLTSALMRALLPVIAVLWLLCSLGVGLYMQHELEEQLDAGLVESAERLLDLAMHDARNHQQPSEKDGALFISEVPSQKTGGSGHDVMMYQVVNDQHELLLRSADAPQQALPLPLQTGFANTDGLRVYTLAQPERGMHIHVGDPLEHRRAARNETLTWLMVPVLAVLPLLALPIIGVTRRVLAPAGRLAQEIQRRDGNHLQPIQAQGMTRELQTIADSTNHLLLRLSDALDTERALSANAAHELRTPLAAVRLSLQSALDQVGAGQAKEPLQDALISLDRLSRRCEKLLQLSRAESGAALGQERVNLGHVAAAVAQEFWADPDLLKRLQLSLPESEDVWVMGDADVLAIAARNLLENAARYAPSGPIELEVAAPATLIVRDHGPGIPADQLSEVLHRHRRQGGLGRVQVPGFGLGLSIIQAIVDRQGGSLTLLSPPPGRSQGLEATLCLRECS